MPDMSLADERVEDEFIRALFGTRILRFYEIRKTIMTKESRGGMKNAMAIQCSTGGRRDDDLIVNE